MSDSEILLSFTELSGVFLGLTTLAFTSVSLDHTSKEGVVFISNLKSLIATNSMIVAACLIGLMILTILGETVRAWALIGGATWLINLPLLLYVNRRYDDIVTGQRWYFRLGLICISIGLFHAPIAAVGLYYFWGELSIEFSKAAILTAFVASFLQVLAHFLAMAFTKAGR